MKLTAGSLRVKELKAFLEASYNEDAPKQIDNYILDSKLSNLYGKVYVNHELKKVIITFRGTGSENLGRDWLNNLVYVSSKSYTLTPRFKTAKKMYVDALKKYKGYQFESIGHSQGALLARLLSYGSMNSIGVNPAYKDESMKNNQYIIRSSMDAVSSLVIPQEFLNSLLYPKWSRNHLIKIPAVSNNPIEEHKIDILDRLDPDKKIGRGGAKYPHNMYKGNNLIVAKNEDDHNELKKAGYDHSPPQSEGHIRRKRLQSKGGAIPKNKKLYDKVKKEMDIIYDKPSAYKSGAIVKKYKSLGGEYIEDNKPKNLKKWFDEEWVNLANINEYPVLRPTKRINKTTPLTVDEIPKENLKKQIKLKQKIKGNSNLPKFEGGSRNAWIIHVKNYAKENNISYGCAISEASKTYKKFDKAEKEEQFKKEQIITWNNSIKRFMKRYDDDNNSLPLIQVNIKNRPKTFQDHLKKVQPEFYKILTEKL